MDCFIHQTYGRMRVRVAALKGNLQSCRELMRQLAALPGVQRVAANDVTGSIIVHYDPQSIPAARILRIFQERKLLHNVIGFPNAHIRPGMMAKGNALQVEDWVSETVSFASKAIFKSLLEAALQKTGQILLKKILL